MSIFYSPTGNGHRAAARALEQALACAAPDVQVDVLDVLRFAPASFRYDRLWELIQHHGGRFYDGLFDLSDGPHPLWCAARERLNLKLLAPLVDELVRLQPDRIVCTHYLPAIAVAHLRRTRRISSRVSTVITDYLAHEAWLCPGMDRYYVPTPGVAEQLLARAASPASSSPASRSPPSVVGALGMKINFFNFVALPITLGVGADYAANLASRLGRESADRAMAGTGAAVALCSLTTIIGYSSLLSSTNPALRSFGVLADIGEVTCLAAALVFLPALARRP